MPQLSLDALQQEFFRALTKVGFARVRADVISRIFTENQRDGVSSHGLNRFPGFIASVRDGRVDPMADCVPAGGIGAMEQWDGQRGAGPWNAQQAMGRAIELARLHGLGCVGLRNTNHWMRAGTYGLQAADAGCIGLCWTNTTPLMPPWGSAQPKLGNNPLVIAVPRPGGHLLMDAAMTQYSNGRLEMARQRGETLPVAGGYDDTGNLTRDAGAILASRRPLPIGHWKGSALSIVLDAVAVLLSGGRSTAEIGRQATETAVSQVFIAIDSPASDRSSEQLDAIITDLHSAIPFDPAHPVRYPGERMAATRQESLAHGVWVDAAAWITLQGL